MKLVLFDIDGTLISSGGAGTRSMNLAFEDVFSIPDAFKGITMAGKTDIRIMKEGLRKHGLDSENGNVPRLCAKYLEHLRTQIKTPRKHLKPGIREAILRLYSMDNVYLGLLTGNLEEGARIKLGSFDLNRFFPLGAFGSDDEDRNRLLPYAVERFRITHKKDIAYSDCIVIGDTPRDVECAKAFGAYSVAVATGPYSSETLAKSNPDMLLRDISEMNHDFISQPLNRNASSKRF